MSSKTKIVVLHMKEVIYTVVFVVLGILLILLLTFMFLPNDEKHTSKKQEYMPGVYTSTVTLNNTSLEVEVAVDSSHINSIRFSNLDETVATMYPLIQPAIENIAEQVYDSQSLENISLPEDNPYTSQVIINAINLFFFGFHWWIERRPTVVYSKNSQVNMVLNQLTKRMWTICLLACAVVNTAAWLYMSICMIKNQWLTSADFCIYILLQIIASAVLMGGLCWLLQKKKEVMSVNTEMIETDDDVYWKNGWYSNPHDKRLFVQDRMCGMNYSMNMAKTSAKIFTAVISAVLIGCAVWIAAILVEFATTEVTVEMKNGIMDIRAAYYDYQIKTEDILAVKMIEEMPEDN